MENASTPATAMDLLHRPGLTQRRVTGGASAGGGASGGTSSFGAAAPPSTTVTLTLEDQVFGAVDDTDAPEALASDGAAPHPHAPSRTIRYGPLADGVGRCMVPLVVCLVLVVIVVWSLTKSLQYSELFTTNPRYQYGLWSLNVGVIVVATLVLCASRPVVH